MSVSIRLRREGSRNKPHYKVVVADNRSPRDGKFIEIIGTYDPKKTGLNANVRLDRFDYWVSVGAQPSDTVRSLAKKVKAAGKAGDAPAADAKPAPATQAPEPAQAPAPEPVEEKTAESAAPAPAAEETSEPTTAKED